MLAECACRVVALHRVIYSTEVKLQPNILSNFMRVAITNKFENNYLHMKKQIVVVDDFENTRWVIEFTLKAIECEILKASNGKEALSFFDGRTIDLLITDLNMPVMDGIQLVKEVKAKAKYRIMPIIMLTTEKKPELKQEAINLQITTWIQKPFKNDEFLKIVKKCLTI